MYLTEASNRYHRQLLRSPEGMAWHQARGLSEETIRKFRLGWISEPLSAAAVRLVGSAVIPYVTLSGRVVELRVRKMDGKPKYLRLDHDFPIPLLTKIHLFNARHAMPSPRTNEVFIVEGEYDCMIAVQSGLRAVAVPGALNWNSVWTNLLSESKVKIAFDGDNGGREGIVSLSRELASKRIDAETVDLPEGKDLTDLWLEGGRELVRRSLGVPEKKLAQVA